MQRNIWLFVLMTVGWMACDNKPQPRQRIEIETRFGKMLLELYNETPQHRDNFVKLVQQGFYDSLLFHRVTPKVYIQGGDPESHPSPPQSALLGKGGTGYTLPAEMDTQFICKRGALVAFHEGEKVNPSLQSSGAQFMIIQGQPIQDYQLEEFEKQHPFHYTDKQKDDYRRQGGMPSLDRKHTIFGEMLDGFDVLDSIAQAPTAMRLRPIKDIPMKIRLLAPQQ